MDQCISTDTEVAHNLDRSFRQTYSPVPLSLREVDHPNEPFSFGTLQCLPELLTALLKVQYKLADICSVKDAFIAVYTAALH